MSNSPMTIIRPRGPQQQRLEANTGLDHYTVDGNVAAAVFQSPMGLIKVWTFRYADICETVVRTHMLKETIGKRGLTLKEALDYLARVPCAVPQDQVDIEVIE